MSHLNRFCVAFLCCSIILLGLVQAQEQQPKSPLLSSFARYQQQKSATSLGLEWISVGPLVNSARVEAVQVDPANPGTIYLAFGSGTLWKSSDNGLHWEPKFNDVPTHGIGDFALAPSNTSVIYLGTGESLKKPRNFTIPGTGVYRSDDAGETWRHLGLDDSRHVSEIAVHPTNPDIALVAVLGHFWSDNPHRGLYRTEDGGKSWQQVLFVDDQTGANDVVWSPTDPTVVYTSMWQHSPEVNGPGSAIYRSSDAGRTWQKCTKGLPSGAKIGRIGLAVSQTDSQKAYALIDHRGKIQEGAAQVYKTEDGGASWEKTHQQKLKFLSRIGWYFADIYVNPKDDEEIFALGVRVAHSKDGGKTFEYLSGDISHLVPSESKGLHLDHCEMWIHPENPNHLALGNDGGFYQSFNKGRSWLHHNNIPTGEFYDIELDDAEPYRIYAGAQDDSTVFGTAQEIGRSRTTGWNYLWIDPWNGGDGCITLIDSEDPNTVYFSAQEGAFRRKDMSKNKSVGISAKLPEGHTGELQFNFVGPMTLSPHDSKTLYLAGNYIFRSRNRGDDWELISDNIGASDDEERVAAGAGAIAESPLSRGLLYVGTDKGQMLISEDEGKSWVNRSEGLPIAYIRSIIPSQYEPDCVYITMSGLNYDDFGTYVFRSYDRGRTWEAIHANLEQEPANTICESPFDSDSLFLGTFRGVYFSTDRGESWELMGRNLPACSVSEILVQKRTKDLVVSTHGRGIYKVNLHPLQRLIKKTDQLPELFEIPTSTRPYLSDTRPGDNFQPFEKVVLSYWIPKSGTSELLVRDKAENVVCSIQIESKAGLNQHRWDLVTGSEESPEPYFIEYKKHLKPGSYSVQLNFDGVTSKPQTLEVLDPN
ncbi:MAG: hypothetical protein AAF483_29035 [Planctomycetota bacterium]